MTLPLRSRPCCRRLPNGIAPCSACGSAGSPALATRAALDAALERAAGEFVWLDVLADDLAAEPDERDMAALAAAPATAAAARSLQEMATGGSAEERETARLALRLLYAEARLLERRA